MEREESLMKVSGVVQQSPAGGPPALRPCRHAPVAQVAKHSLDKRLGRSRTEQRARNWQEMDISLPSERPLDLHPQIQSVSIASRAALQRSSSGYSSSSDPLAVFGLPAFAI